MKRILLLVIAVACFTIAWAQDTVYWCDFERPLDGIIWQLVNGSGLNYWTIGTAPEMSSRCVYVTDTGDSNRYNPESRSVVYAYRRVALPRGEGCIQ